MEWYQIVMIVFFITFLSRHINNHGEAGPRYNAFGAIFSVSLHIFLLYFGGFWS